ncbi:Fic family protein [Paracoccus aminophilus]|nr:hypothetical protein [Paracoccus aminophilus]
MSEDPEESPDLSVPEVWRGVQAALSAELAATAFAVGQLDADLAAMPPDLRAGALRRLALREADAVLRAEGHALSPEDLAAELLDAAGPEDAEALRFARWAVRRFEGRGREADVGQSNPLRAFLGLHRSSDGLGQGARRLLGADFDAAAAEFLQRIDAAGLHPFARGPLARLLWRLAGLSPAEIAAEATVWVGCDAARGCPALSFLPCGAAQHRLLVEVGAPQDRLHRHLEALRAGAVEARHHLAAVRGWHQAALAEAGAIKGQNPGRILAVLAAHPLMHTADVATRAEVSRITAERLLARLAEMGLVREATGAKRFRLWGARLR